MGDTFERRHPARIANEVVSSGNSSIPPLRVPPSALLPEGAAAAAQPSPPRLVPSPPSPLTTPAPLSYSGQMQFRGGFHSSLEIQISHSYSFRSPIMPIFSKPTEKINQVSGEFPALVQKRFVLASKEVQVPHS